MKRITPSFPVDELRGKLAGKQKLEYAEKNNPAYESPKGQRNYARNYRTCLVACKRSSDGKQYFQIRTKSSVNMTAKAVRAMALMGGTGAIVGFILGHKSSELYANCYAQWLELQSNGSKKTFRKTLSDVVMQGLKDKVANIPFAGPRGVVQIDNPWNTTSSTPNVSVSNAVLAKFWSELAASPITFTAGDYAGIARTGESFGDLATSNHNTLNISGKTVPNVQETVAGIGDYYLTYNEQPVVMDDLIVNNRAYDLVALDN